MNTTLNKTREETKKNNHKRSTSVNNKNEGIENMKIQMISMK
jgi:hypothetical protein